MEVLIEGGGRKHTLDEDQRWILAGELAKVKSTRSTHGVLPKLAPDCTIKIHGSGWTESYEIYARSILRETSSNEVWQFYFGLIVLEWLYS